MDGLATAAVVVAVWLALGGLVCLVSATFVMARWVRRLNSRNRLVPFSRTAAPLWWLWSPRLAARLHRRLCGALAPVAALVPRPRRAPGPLAELASDVVALAQATDSALVEAGGYPVLARRRALAAIEADVEAVEDLSRRLHEAAKAWTADPATDRRSRAGALAERLDAIESARRDLADLDPLSATPAPGSVLPAPDWDRPKAGRGRRLVG